MSPRALATYANFAQGAGLDAGFGGRFARVRKAKARQRRKVEYSMLVARCW